MTLRVAPGVLVRACREEEVAGERARLRAVDLRLVVELEVIPARAAVHAEADVADRVALAIAERREVGAEEVRVEAVALDRDDVVVLDAQRHRLAHVRLEREV